MKAPPHPKASRQIRVVRVSRPSVIRALERDDSSIPSAVDSWLSTIPSAKARIMKQPPKQSHPPPIAQPSPINDQKCRRICMIVCAVLLTILLIGSIIGVVLAVKLQTTETSVETTTTTPH